jgi:sugar lactone lactonase YvrE
MNDRTNRVRSSLVILTLALAACGDDGVGAGGSAGDSAGGAGGDGGAQASAGGTGGSGGEGTASGGGGAGGGAEAQAEVLAPLDPAAFEFPEGLYVDGDRAIVGFAFTGALEAVDLATGARTPLGAAPTPPQNTAFMTGVSLDSDDRILAAYVSFTDAAAPGIYRTAPGGGDASLWASAPEMVFPNGLAWGEDGRLFVTDSAYGGVFAVDADGEVTSWVQDELLSGAPTACGQPADALPVGANGLVWTPEGLLVASSDRGLLARVPFEVDGSAGALEVIAGPDCELLGGIDGLTLDEDGTVIAAINRTNTLVRVDPAGGVETIFSGPPLDFPASPMFGGQGSERALYVTSFALGSFLGGGSPAPAIVRVR